MSKSDQQQPAIERRFVKGGQLRKSAGGKPGIEGYASVFNQDYDTGWFVETIKPGAFARALAEKQDVRCLFNHDPNNLLARTKSKTLRLSEDSAGLHFEADLNPETRVSADVQAMIDRGDLDGCSFGFQVRKCSWREVVDEEGRATAYRDIEDVDLFDVGPVTYPAYEGTSVGARSLWPAGVPAEIRSHVPGLRADGKEEDAPKTKRVDGEDLPKEAFLIVLDPEKTSTWDLPWKFSTTEKIESHLRDALARFNQLEDVPAAAKTKAWKKLLSLCAHFGIHVADKTEPRSVRADDDGDEDQDGDAGCDCDCRACQAGNCEECSGDHERMRMKMRLALAQVS